VIVYTAIFGRYDRPHPAPEGGGVLFTDEAPKRARGWDVRVTAPADPANPARSNRAIKLQPHVHLPTAERTVYVDGRMGLRVSGLELTRRFITWAGGDHDVFALTHSLGHTAHDEFAWVRERRITSEPVLREQQERYRLAGMPDDLPTAQAGVLVVRRTPAAITFMDVWWEEVRRYSHRDQLSLPYAAWLTGADVHLVPIERARALWVGRPHARPQLVGAS
jgi:hypothetical protein